MVQGGLCGLAALQHALGSSLATRSQLRKMSYDVIRLEMSTEMGMSSVKARALTDADLLLHFHDCKSFHVHSLLTSFSKGLAKTKFGRRFLVTMLLAEFSVGSPTQV